MVAAISIYLFIRVLDALADTLAHHKGQSIFSEWTDVWWAQDSWLNKYINRDPDKGRTWVPVQFTDYWHHFKMWEIFLVTYFIFSPYYSGWQLFFIWGFFGVLGNLIFSLFYDKLFIRKKK